MIAGRQRTLEMDGEELLTLVTDNLQGSLKVLDLATQLHLQALNVRLGTAQLGDQGRTFMPIAAEVGSAMRHLKEITTVYQSVSESFIQSIGAQLKTARLVRLFDGAIERMRALNSTRMSPEDFLAYCRALSRTMANRLHECARDVEKILNEIDLITKDLKSTAQGGHYTSEIAKIESVRIGGVSQLSIACASMSRCLNDLMEEVKAMKSRLRKVEELLKKGQWS